MRLKGGDDPFAQCHSQQTTNEAPVQRIGSIQVIPEAEAEHEVETPILVPPIFEHRTADVDESHIEEAEVAIFGVKKAYLN